MFFNLLSLPEFLLLFGTVSGLVVTLYLLSRARRKQVVSTLRFWVHASQPVPSSRRRWIQQPWSLLLQLLSLALLLLALAQLKIGNRETAQRDHVLLLDSSSWMGARTANGQGMLLDEAKRKARSFVRSLPPSDRVMVVRVEGLPSPATGMEKNRDKIERAIRRNPSRRIRPESRSGTLVRGPDPQASQQQVRRNRLRGRSSCLGERQTG